MGPYGAPLVTKMEMESAILARVLAKNQSMRFRSIPMALFAL